MFGDGQVLGDTFWNTKLVKLKDGIRSNYCTGRKINTLSHEVSSDSTFFSFEPRPDVLDATAILKFSFRYIWLTIVHNGSNPDLQLQKYLVLVLLHFSKLNHLSQHIIIFDDLLVGLD